MVANQSPWLTEDPWTPTSTSCGPGSGLGDVAQAQDVTASVGVLDYRAHQAVTTTGASRPGLFVGTPLVTK